MAIVNTLSIRFQLVTNQAKQAANGLANGIRGLGARFNKFAQQNRTLGDVVGNLKNKLASLNPVMAALVAVIGAMAFAINKAVRETVDFADQLAKTSTRIGVAVETLSQLKLAAELSGSSIERITPAFRTLARVVDEARTGNVLYAEALERVGIEAKDLNRPLGDLFEVVADGLANTENAGERLALAMEVLGRGGTELLPLLAGGAEGIRAMRKEADELGLTISTDFAKRSEVYNDTLSRISATGTGLKQVLAEALLPAYQAVADITLKVARATSKFLIKAIRDAQFQVFRLGTSVSILAKQFQVFINRIRGRDVAQLERELDVLFNELAMGKDVFFGAADAARALAGGMLDAASAAEQLLVEFTELADEQEGITPKMVALATRLIKLGDGIPILDQLVARLREMAQTSTEAARALERVEERIAEEFQLEPGILPIPSSELERLRRQQIELSPFLPDLERLRQEQEKMGPITLPVDLTPVEQPELVFDRDFFGEARIAAEDYFAGVVDLGRTAFSALDSFSTQFSDGLIEGAAGAKIKFGEFFKDLLKQLAKAIVRALILRAILGIFGGGLAGTLKSLGIGPANVGFPGPGSATMGEAARARNVSSAVFGAQEPALATAGGRGVRVVVHEATPQTWVEVIDNQVEPRMRQRRDDLNEESL